MNNERAENILVIGIGNEFRNDDGIGLYVAKKLRDIVPKNIKVMESTGDGADIMNAWKGYKKVILTDAVQSTGSKPGEIFRIDLVNQKLDSENKFSTSHLFSVYDAVEASRVMGILPAEATFYGIAGSDFNFGNVITEKVRESGDKAARQILDELK